MAIGDQPAFGRRRFGHQRLQIIAGQASALQPHGLQQVAVGAPRAETVAHPASAQEAPFDDPLGPQGAVAERIGEGLHLIPVQSLGCPGGVPGQAGVQFGRRQRQGRDVLIGVAPDLVPRRVQGLQMLDLELRQVQIAPARQAAADIVGGLDVMFGQHRPRLGPGGGGNVVERQAEHALRRLDRHGADIQITAGAAAHLVDQGVHTPPMARRA